MSVQALSAVLKESQSRLGARLVLIAIANHADEKGMKSFPNLETLASEALLSIRQVQRCIKTLESLGELRVKTRFKTSNLYRIILPSLVRHIVMPQVELNGDKSGPEMSLQPSGTISSSNDKSGFVLCDFCDCAVLERDVETHMETCGVAS